MNVKEKEVKYQFNHLAHHRMYDEKLNKKKKNEKIFFRILSRKSGMASFLNEFLLLKEEIKENQILHYQTSFTAKQNKSENVNLVYQLKNKPIYFLVQHQSRIEQDILIRLWQYVGEIMRKESMIQETYLKKEKIYPVVVPIIIYSGSKQWNIVKADDNVVYNLIIIQDDRLIKMLYNLERKGWKRRRQEIVRNMLKAGETEEKIMQYTQISQKELATIKKIR